MAILRIPRSDDTSSFVLLNITPTSTDSPTLNGKIAGTDGSSAFILQLKPALAARARAAKAACSEEEWTTILKSTLLDGLMPKDVEITATVDGEKEIQVVFRKTFQGGLKQRLGSLNLKGDADEEIELFEWCGAMAKQAAEQGKALQQEKQKLGKLVKETQDLVKAKEEAEKEVIGKCMRLVNSKKEKIQELRARLSHYEGDPPRDEPLQVEEPAEEEAPQPARRGRGKAAAKGKGKEKEPTKTTLPRRGKRAAPDPEPEEEDTEPPKDEDDVDMDQDEEDVETEGEDTPSDHSVEDEVPEVRTRAEPQGQSQTQRCSQKKASPAEEEDDGPHVTTRAASHSQNQKNTAHKGEGSETESDDEL